MTTYADRPWTKHYDAGVPASLKPYPEKTLFGLMQDSAAKFADRPALTMTTRLPLVGHQQRTLTYAELDRESDALAAGRPKPRRSRRNLPPPPRGPGVRWVSTHPCCGHIQVWKARVAIGSTISRLRWAWCGA